MKIHAVVLNFAMVMALAACAGQGISTDTSSQTVSTGLRACLMAQAANKIQDNTVFTVGITETAKEITTTCLKNLALQSAGLEEETLTLSQSILTTLAQSATAGATN